MASPTSGPRDPSSRADRRLLARRGADRRLACSPSGSRSPTKRVGQSGSQQRTQGRRASAGSEHPGRRTGKRLPLRGYWMGARRRTWDDTGVSGSGKRQHLQPLPASPGWPGARHNCGGAAHRGAAGRSSGGGDDGGDGHRHPILSIGGTDRNHSHRCVSRLAESRALGTPDPPMDPRPGVRSGRQHLSQAVGEDQTTRPSRTSNTRVTGPSLIRSTAIIAPNRPVAT
jgi:hypothetical protein